MNLIDSHCHLDDFLKNGQLDLVLRNAKQAKIDKLIAVGTHYDDWVCYRELVAKYEHVFYTIGVHPIYTNRRGDVAKFNEFLLRQKRPLAIGEIGLDYYHLPADSNVRHTMIDMQKQMFLEQVAFAKKSLLPIVVHSRQAFDDTLTILSQSGIESDCVLFHCFDYGTGEMERLKDFGAFVSFSGMLTFKKKLIEPLKLANPQKLLIETDCPYLSPEPHRGKVNEPAYLRATARYAAQLLQMSEGEFCDLTYTNTKKFFKI